MTMVSVMVLMMVLMLVMVMVTVALAMVMASALEEKGDGVGDGSGVGVGKGGTELVNGMGLLRVSIDGEAYGAGYWVGSCSVGVWMGLRRLWRVDPGTSLQNTLPIFSQWLLP